MRSVGGQLLGPRTRHSVFTLTEEVLGWYNEYSTYVSGVRPMRRTGYSFCVANGMSVLQSFLSAKDYVFTMNLNTCYYSS